MTLLKKSVPARKAALSVSGRAALKAAAKRASRQRKAAATRGVPQVSRVTAGGYTVFGSPVRPAHLTPEQIAEAIAELD